MSDLTGVDVGRQRLAKVQTPEQATDLIDEIDDFREACRIIDAAPAQINEITLLKVETRAKRADLIDAGQKNGVYRKHGGDRRSSSERPELETLPVAWQRIEEDRVLRGQIDEVRRVINESTTEVIDSWLLEQARRRRAQTKDRVARTIEPATGDHAGDDWTLLAGQVEERLADIDPASIDMIVTDPPYPAESLPLWSVLAEHAARLLTPQGILVGLSGKIMLPDVIARLAEHLHYGWVYCEPLPGSSSRILARHVGQEWKPWLAFSNGQWPSGRIDWHGDMLTGVPKSKDLYHWQQSEQSAGELIVRLSPVNGTVLDPFCGTGTYGLAALRAGRQFIGIDADAGRLAQAAQRLGEL